MVKIAITILLLCNVLFGGEIFYGIEMNAKLKNPETYKMYKPSKAYPNRIDYSKKLKDSYFNEITIYTDLNNVVYQIQLVKNNIFEAQKFFIELQKKYGAFSCKDNIIMLIGKIGDDCKSINTTRYGNSVELHTATFGKNPLFRVVYKSKYIYKIIPKSKEEQRLDNNL